MPKNNKVMKLSILAMLLLVFLIPITGASLFVDEEKSENNKIGASELNLSFETKDSTSFETEPDTEVKFKAVIKNDGELSFVYGQKYEFSSGDEDFCNEISLKVFYHGEEKYSGLLKDFDLEGDPDDPDLAYLMHPNSEDGDNPHEYAYTLQTPDSTDFFGNTCSFYLLATAWQDEILWENGFWDADLLEFEIAMVDDLETLESTQSED